MRAIILLGRYSANTFEAPHVLYCGLDGTQSQKAAADACATGKYAKGGQIVEFRNPSGRPFAVVPVIPKLKVPTTPATPMIPTVPSPGQDGPFLVPTPEPPKAPTSPKQPKTNKTPNQ